MKAKQGPFRNKKNIILASRSPRRQRLLTSLGIYFEVTPSRIKEEKEAPSPEEMVLTNARKKVMDVHKGVKGVILGADTCVVLEDSILGKPRDHEEALCMLKSLRGRWHQVFTGCFLLDNTRSPFQEKNFVVQSRVFISPLPEEVIEAYIATSDPFDKAGSYGIQGIGSFLVKEIQGSYTNVVGLPLTEVVEALIDMEAIYAAR